MPAENIVKFIILKKSVGQGYELSSHRVELVVKRGENHRTGESGSVKVNLAGDPRRAG